LAELGNSKVADAFRQDTWALIATELVLSKNAAKVKNWMDVLAPKNFPTHRTC